MKKIILISALICGLTTLTACVTQTSHKIGYDQDPIVFNSNDFRSQRVDYVGYGLGGQGLGGYSMGGYGLTGYGGDWREL